MCIQPINKTIKEQSNHLVQGFKLMKRVKKALGPFVCCQAGKTPQSLNFYALVNEFLKFIIKESFIQEHFQA